MIRQLALVLSLAGCAAPEPAAPPALPFRTCLPLPAPLPKLRTIEAVAARADAVERVALDCQERMRRNAEAHDAMTARK